MQSVSYCILHARSADPFKVYTKFQLNSCDTIRVKKNAGKQLILPDLSSAVAIIDQDLSD